MARFEAPKASKPPQQLSQALEPHTPPQQLSKACRLLGHGTSPGPTSCFYWASKLLCGTFWAGPKASKPPQQLSQALEPHTPPQQLSKACRLLGHGTSLGPTSCFYWASKLLCGTFWAGPKSPKTSAAAFAGLGTSHPSAAAFKGVPLAWPWYLPRPHKLFLLGFETATWHVLGRPQKPQNLRSSFGRPWNLTTLCSNFRRRAACLAMVSKLLCGTFWAGLESLKTSAAAFEGLRTSQPSAAAFRGVPLAWPWYLPRPHKLLLLGLWFLLGFETAMWHVLGRPYKPQNLRSSFRRP